MATRAGDITFGVGFQVDKSGLQQLQQQLQQLQQMTLGDMLKLNPSDMKKAISDLTAVQNTAQQVNNALGLAFNPKLNTINITRFHQALKDSNITVKEIGDTLSKAGATGQMAFTNIANKLLTSNIQLKEHNKLLVDMGKTLANSIKYTLSYGLVNNITSALSSAVQYSKALDSSLNDIRIVTDKSADDMERFAESANKAARELGQSTTDYTRASLIYYQQGLTDEDVQARTDVTLKAANVTGQSTQEVSEQLTAVWNGYKASAAEAELYVDKLAAVAATTASDLEELSTGMSKVASAAAAMGVDVDQLNGMLSTIISVTRQAPESAGTALKTIFARMGDLKIDGEDEFGVSLGEVSGQLAEVGINIMNAKGELRDMGKVIEEVGQKWNTGEWSQAEKQAIAIELAGKRQYNNLLALFDNWDMYNKAVETSLNSQGTLQKQQDIYMESTVAHIQQMQTAWEGVKAELIKPENIIPIIDAFSDFAQIVEKAINTLGGIEGVFKSVGAIGLQVFGSQIGSFVNSLINNSNIAKQNILQLRGELNDVYAVISSEAFVKEGPEGPLHTLVAGAQQLQNAYNNLDPAIIQVNKDLLNNAVTSENTALHLAQVAEKAAEAANKMNITEAGNFDKFNIQILNEATIGELETPVHMLTEELEKAKVAAAKIKVGKDFPNEIQTCVDYAINLTEVLDLSKVSGKVRVAINTLQKLQDKTNLTKQESELLKASIQTITKECGPMGEALQEALETGNEGFQNARNEADRYLEQVRLAQEGLNTSNFTANLSQAVGAISSMTFGIQSLVTGFKNLQEDGMTGLVGITMGFTQIGAAAKNGIPAIQNLLGITKQIQAVESVSALLKEKNILLGGKEATQEAVREALKKKTLVAMTLENLSRDKNIASIIEANKEKGIEVIQEALVAAGYKEEAASIAMATSAQKSFTAALIANPLTWVVAGLAAAVAGFIAYKNHADQVAKAERENNLERIKAKDSLLEEANAHKTLFDSYNKAYTEYVKTGKIKDNLISATEELIEQYKIENGQLLLLQGNYDELTKKINEKRIVELKAQQDTAEINLGRIAPDAEQAEQGTWYQSGVGSTEIINGTGAYALLNDNVNALLRKNEYVDAGGETRTKLTIDVDWNDVDKAQKQVKALQDQLNEWDRHGVKSSDPVYKMISDYLHNDEISSYIEELNKNISARNQAILQKADYQSGGLDAATSIDEYNQRVEEFKKILSQNTHIKQKDIEDYLSTLSGEYAKLAKSYDSQLSNLSVKTRQYIREHLSEDDVEIFLTMQVDENTSDKNIEDYIERTRRKRRYDMTYDVSETTASLGEALQDKNISSKERKSINEQIENLRVAGYEEELKDFDNKGLVERLGILQDISEKQAEIQRQMINMSEEDAKAENIELARTKLLEEKKAAYDVINSIPLDERNGSKEYQQAQESLEKLAQALKVLNNDSDKSLEEIEEKLSEILDRDYEIEIEFKAAESSDIVNFLSNQTDTLVNDIEGLQSAAEMFAENWTVAQENAEKMAQSLPEIFEAVESINDDGSITFEKERLNAILDTKQAEIEATRDNLLLQLEADQQRLENKKTQLEAQLEIAKQVADGELSIDGAMREAEAQGLDNYSTFIEQQYNAWVTGNVDTDEQIVASTDSATQAMRDDINQVTEAWNQMWKAKISGEGVAVTTGGVSSYSAGIKAVSMGVKDNADDYIRKNKDQINAASKAFGEVMQQSLEEQITQTEKELAQTMANIADLKGSAGKYINALNRVKEGKAGKEDKSKSSKESEDKKQLLKLEDEVDLYREINEQLEEVDHNLKMISKETDRTYGAQHIENLKKENQQLAKQQELLKQKLKLTAQDIANRKALLSSKGLTFDADGQISNYASMLTDKVNEINKLYTQYNEETQKDLKTKYKTLADNAKEEYESLKKSIDAYDKMLDQYRQLQEDIIDAYHAQIDKQIEAFNYKIDIDLDMSKATKRWNEFKRNVIDDIEGIADPVKKIIEQMKAGIEDYRQTYSAGGDIAIDTNAVRELMNQYNQMMATGSSDIYGDNSAQLIADLEKRKEDLMKSVEDAEQMIRDMRKLYLDGLDEAYDKMQKHTEQYEYISNLIEHDMNLIELLRGEDAYEDLGRYYDQQAQNNLKNVENLRMQRDALKEQLEGLEENSEAWKKVYKQLQDAEVKLREEVEKSVQTLLDKYENGLNKILKDLDKKMTGGLGIDEIEKQYERQQDLADDYLDTIERGYALEKLRAKFTDALNNTSDIGAQTRINKLMKEQLDTMEDIDKLAQYRVDYAEKLLDVELARIALEEAQQNKSQMRLKRDSQGNYTYQYVADDDAINKAQQDLLDAQNDLWKFDKEGLAQAQQDGIELWRKYLEDLRDLYADPNLSPEERDRKIAELNEYYSEKMQENAERLAFFKTSIETDANNILAGLYGENSEEFRNTVIDDMIPTWGEGVDQMIEKFAKEGIPECQEALDLLEENTDDYRQQLEDLADAANMDFDEICSGIDRTIDYTYDLMHTNEEVIDSYRQEMDELDRLNDMLDDVQRQFDRAKQEAIDMARAATEAIQKANDLRAACMEAKAAADAAGMGTGDSGSNSSNNSSSNSSNNTSSSSSEKEYGYRITGDYIKTVNRAFHSQTDAKNAAHHNVPGSYEIVNEGWSGDYYVITVKKRYIGDTSDYYSDTGRRFGGVLPTFASGGYTGDWHSSDGKIAMLHEKEIVLNKDDTKNMLAAVEVVRHIVSSLDGSMNSRVAGMAINPEISQAIQSVGGASAVDQNVHIEASFPSVTNHNEIEEAFNNLVNIASQKALNTRR